ncbi:MAG: response regulator [Desulfuromonadaceae bacterium]|nr:response regulator [Desulfuromonadaceae bacterium]
MAHRILVVDDDQELRETISEILVDAGFFVANASSGEEALKILSGETFDLVLLDMIMPGIGGQEILPLLKRQAPRTRIIMITAFATVENAVAAMRKGADDYLTKPFKVDELLTAVRRRLEEARFLDCGFQIEMDSTFSCLANSIRRDILKLIGRKQRLRFMDITRHLGIEDHTKMNFHLKMLRTADLVGQDEHKNYILTPQGGRILTCLSQITKDTPPQ